MNNNVWHKLNKGIEDLPKNGDSVEFKVKDKVETKVGRFRDTSCYNKVFEVGDGWEYFSNESVQMWRRISEKELDNYEKVIFGR